MPSLFKAIVFALVIAGVGYGASIWITQQIGPIDADEKLAAAFPLAPHLQARLDNIARFDDPAGVQNAQEQLQVRLRYRLLKCAPTYVPSWYHSIASVQAHVANPTCFARQDAALAQWAGLIEIGLILRQPPLRPLALKPGPKVTAEANIDFVHYAAHASIAILHMRSSAQVVDLATGQMLVRIPSPERRVRELSANGRLFSEQGEGGELYIKDTESGRTLSKMPVTQGCRFAWLDVRTAACLNGQYLSFIDFNRGELIQTELPAPPFANAAPVPGKADHYVLMSAREVIEVQLVMRDSTPKAQLLRKVDGQTLGFAYDWDALNRSELSADGNAYLLATERGQLLVFSLQDLQSRLFDTGPLRVNRVLPTADPNKVLLYGDMAPAGYSMDNGVVLDIEQQRMAPVTSRVPVFTRVDFVSAIPAIALIKGRTLTLTNDLATGEPVELGQWREQVTRESAEYEVARQAALKQFQARNKKAAP